MMTDIILGLILVFAVLIWSQRSTWIETQRHRAKKRRAQLRKRVKNWKAHRRQDGERRRVDTVRGDRWP